MEKKDWNEIRISILNGIKNEKQASEKEYYLGSTTSTRHANTDTCEIKVNGPEIIIKDKKEKDCLLMIWLYLLTLPPQRISTQLLKQIFLKSNWRLHEERFSPG